MNPLLPGKGLSGGEEDETYGIFQKGEDEMSVPKKRPTVWTRNTTVPLR
jgi:hypothetical protein